MAISLQVCIPWRPQPDRMAAHKRIRRFWDEEFPAALKTYDPHWVGWYQVVEADSNPAMHWHLAQARNNAVHKGSRDRQFLGASTIVADADTLPRDPHQIIEGVRKSRQGYSAVYPFDEYRYLPKGTDPESPNLALVRPEYVKPNSVGGIVCAGWDSLYALGLWDEKFEPHWGFEDNAFVAVHDTLGKVLRLPGVLYAFGHDVAEGRDWSEKNPNYWRNQLYQTCYGKPELMRELIK